MSRFLLRTAAAVAVLCSPVILAAPAMSSVIDADVTFISYNGISTGNAITAASEAIYSQLTSGTPGTTIYSTYTFHYTGDLDWSTVSATNTVGEFISTGTISAVVGTGGLAGLLATQMSTGGDQKTSFFRLTGTISSSAPFTGSLTHDDGVTFIVNGATLVNSPIETSQIADNFATLAGFSNAPFILDYVEGNGTPSVLRLDITSPVPEASTWAMMILGFLGLGFIGYRRSSTASGSAFRMV